MSSLARRAPRTIADGADGFGPDSWLHHAASGVSVSSISIRWPRCGHADQRVERELVELVLEQEVDARLGDAAASGRLGLGPTLASDDVLDLHHQLGPGDLAGGVCGVLRSGVEGRLENLLFHGSPSFQELTKHAASGKSSTASKTISKRSPIMTVALWKIGTQGCS